ncbi:hypothetical protein AAFC00_004762 [Neodothiora populina]
MPIAPTWPTFFAVAILFLICIVEPVLAGGWTCGAVGLSAAVQAGCPAANPVSCSSIGMANNCCPSGNYCAYTSDQQAVGCCPNGQTCSGSIDNWDAGGGGWQQTTTTVWPQTSTWAPTTTYWQPSTHYVTTAIPTTTVYGGLVVTNGVSTVSSQYLQQQTTTQNVYGAYCSTLYANGGNLPTTRAGDCGTILVLSAGTRILSDTRMLIGVASVVLFHLAT